MVAGVSDMSLGKIKKWLKKTEPAVPLLEAVNRARREWQDSWRELSTAEGCFIDYVIYKMNAAERHYVSLLLQAKKEGLAAWEELSCPQHSRLSGAED